ncbi:NYN domain-containing protein [Phenylobacterium soli]|uniref:Uncharacterized protein n=1 Tax=Phenylobacterium soli TaxID=2170551 RepID=A0A328ABC5_9CAUL|nr:NYN domain-containing protein [Phenylobacterium soli]RAK51757.1 hypothetical protein DJ017_18175 [Phenylobacterium soli]
MRTYVYIDGFNLYYGLLKGSPYKWLNLQALFEAVLAKNDVCKIRYFTAKVEARAVDPDLPVRQATYVRALNTLPKVDVHFGTFLASCVRAPEVEVDPQGQPKRVNGRPVVKVAASGKPIMRWVHKTEEKGSDVNLAAHLLRDVYRGDCECAVVVSNDSDLLTPIRMIKEDAKIPVGLIPPRPNGSLELKRLSTFRKEIRTHHLQAAQFPDIFKDKVGTITKPAGW